LFESSIAYFLSSQDRFSVLAQPRPATASTAAWILTSPRSKASVAALISAILRTANRTPCGSSLLMATSLSHDLGMLTGLSPSHSARKFRQTTGVSLARFVNRRRLQAAIRQFATTDGLLATLAQELGFSSPSHFTRLFSRLTGMRPGRYRRQLRPTVD